MYRCLAALLAGLALVGPAQAECPAPWMFNSLGEIRTSGGGTYLYGMTVGGESVLRGTLTGGPNRLAEQTFDLEVGYHVGIAGAGLARLLAPDATSAEPDGTKLTVGFAPKGGLPVAMPGASWSGTVSATVFAQGADDYNSRVIGEAVLDARYSFLDEISADFDGCPQRIQPVELTLTWQGQIALQRRILFFPDLGVSAITKWGPDADGPAKKTGITGIGLAE
jgi:hypothetical protein